MMTIKECIEEIQGFYDARSIEVTGKVREVLAQAETCMYVIDLHPNLLDVEKRKEMAYKPRVTLGELLDLIDSEREGDDAIELMGHNGEVDIAGRVSSAYFAVLEDHIVNGYGSHNNAVQVWLED